MLDYLLIGLVRSLRHFLNTGYIDWIAGHKYTLKEEDRYNQVLECQRCGHISEGWIE